MSNILEDFRDYKISVVNNEVDFKLSDVFFKKNKEIFNFISKNFPNDIISGSLVLSLFDLIDRQINDIDILIDDKNRYEYYTKGRYSDELSIGNRLGYRNFSYKDGFFSSRKIYKVDFFERKDNINFIEIEFNKMKLKVHHPLSIIETKLSMSKDKKHSLDLEKIFYTQKIKNKIINYDEKN